MEIVEKENKQMKNIKRFEIDVPTSFGNEDYDGEFYPLQFTDLERDGASAADGSAVAEIEIFGDNGSVAAFQLNLDGIDALFDVLNHIRGKVQLDAEVIQNDKNL